MPWWAKHGGSTSISNFLTLCATFLSWTDVLGGQTRVNTFFTACVVLICALLWHKWSHELNFPSRRVPMVQDDAGEEDLTDDEGLDTKLAEESQTLQLFVGGATRTRCSFGLDVRIRLPRGTAFSSTTGRTYVNDNFEGGLATGAGVGKSREWE